jgi:oligoribonuclease
MNRTKGSCLVWFDTEYTSLDLEGARLVQVALVVTDMEGRRVAAPDQDFVTAVRLPPESPVSDFLARECPALVRQARAETAPTVDEVDRALAARLDALCGPVASRIGDRPVLAGNSIHADWWLACRFLPVFLSRLHYRQLDVSSLKLLWLASGFGPEFDKGNIAQIREYLPGWILPAEAQRHDALYDVMCSVAELNFYRKRFIRDQAARL